ncbi:MAG: iron chelate uptake ABC transporter family permease subunit, partial [Bacteroidales bacterium]
MNLFLGSVSIPFKSVLKIISGDTESVKASWNFIIMESRLPQACTALLAGSSLAVSGLMLQTLFKNPLAGPSILGISDGANLGVALLMLAVGTFGGSASSIGLGGYISTILAALIGASIILLIILFFASKVKSNVMLLIIGIMIGYLASSLISILTYHASADKVRQFV